MSNPMKTLFPSLYHSFLPDFFEKESVAEKQSSCSNCAMCAPKDLDLTPKQKEGFFSQSIKCCTYYPKIPNYLVGALLLDSNPDLNEGRKRIREKIKNRIGVTPQWLSPSRKYYLLLQTSRSSSFGRAESLRCPYYIVDSGLCSIWLFREGDCSKFFCKHDSGMDGREYWMALETFFVEMEQILSEFVMSDLDILVDQTLYSKRPGRIQSLSLNETEELPLYEEDYNEMWGTWSNREEDFYKECYKKISSFSKEKLMVALETSRPGLLNQLKSSYDLVKNPVLPVRLVKNQNLEIQKINDEESIYTGYSRYNPVVMVSEIDELLEYFENGADVSKVKEIVLEKDGLELKDELFQVLYQMRILKKEE